MEGMETNGTIFKSLKGVSEDDEWMERKTNKRMLEGHTKGSVSKIKGWVQGWWKDAWMNWIVFMWYLCPSTYMLPLPIRPPGGLRGSSALRRCSSGHYFQWRKEVRPAEEARHLHYCLPVHSVDWQSAAGHTFQQLRLQEPVRRRCIKGKNIIDTSLVSMLWRQLYLTLLAH